MFNLVIVLIFTFVLALVLIYFISAHDRRQARKNKAALQAESADNPQQDFNLFARFCVDLCEYLKLEVKDYAKVSEQELVIRAESKNEISKVDYLVMGYHITSKEELPTALVAAFSDQIVSERIAKGMVITPGLISDATLGLPELASIDFIDGSKMAELQKKIIL